MKKNNLKKFNIGVARLGPMFYLENNFQGNGLSAMFLKGFFKTFTEKQKIRVCSEMLPDEEKILTNNILIKKNNYIESLIYTPNDISDVNVLFIFPNEKNELSEIETEHYESHILSLLKDFKGTVYYMQYNEVLFPLLDKINLDEINFVVLANTNENAAFIYNEDMYGDINIGGYSLDLNQLIYNNRTSRDKQYYIKMSLFAKKFKEEKHNKLVVKQSPLFFLGSMEKTEFYPGVEFDEIKDYQDFVYKMKHSTIVYVDDIYKYLYNPFFIEISNYTLPIIFNKDIKIPEEFKLDIIKWDDTKDKFKDFIIHKSNSKILKQLRATISAHYKDNDILIELDKIMNREG